MKKCPYCKEEILENAKKCKHCGEWLTAPHENERVGVKPGERGSVDARAVTRGLKEKEFHDYWVGCGGCITLVIAIFIGLVTHWIVGLIVFIAIAFILGKWYWKE